MPDTQNVTVMPGSMGSSSPELSRYILDNEEIIDEIMERLMGRVSIKLPDGSKLELRDRDAKRDYKDATFVWIKGKMREVLNKNMSLSKLNAEQSYEMAKWMAVNFCEELWLGWGQYLSDDQTLAVSQYKELTSLYANFLDEIIRHPLEGGIRAMLTTTTAETSANVRQVTTETSEKKGLLGGLLGK